MKQFISASVIVILVLSITTATAQRKKDVYTFFDSSWKKSGNPNKGIYFTRLHKINDTSWRLDTYDVYGPMIRMETFTDKTASLRNGKYASYHRTGYVDSIGQFHQGKAHGDWYYISDAGNYVYKKRYDEGLLVESIELATGDPTLKKDGTPGGLPTLTKQPEFEGGSREWLRYIVKNLHLPNQALDQGIKGNVIVLFEVDTNGKPRDPIPFKSVQTQLDVEAVRLIADSPKWVSGERDGQKVNAIKRQSIAFQKD